MCNCGHHWSSHFAGVGRCKKSKYSHTFDLSPIQDCDCKTYQETA